MICQTDWTRSDLHLFRHVTIVFPFNMIDLKTLIREVPDFPKPGILFYDITTLLKDAAGLKQVIDDFYRIYKNKHVDLVVGIEARGYFFAPALALALGTGFAPVRKPKKLPCEVEFWEYELEYGTDRIEIHKDAITPGQNVLIVDDVLATGGTAAAAGRLVEKLGGRIVGFGFVLELDFLNGRQKLKNYEITSLLHY
jgi:adenine phosphoribosyltransferase